MSAVVERTAWMDRALCVGADPEAWFDKRRRDEAQAICSDCPVAEQCRKAGSEQYRGIWGGIEQVDAKVGPSPVAEFLGFPHGTRRGYDRHRKEGTAICVSCLFATQLRRPRTRSAEQLERQEIRRKELLAERRREGRS